jgi:hypothetical protein
MSGNALPRNVRYEPGWAIELPRLLLSLPWFERRGFYEWGAPGEEPISYKMFTRGVIEVLYTDELNLRQKVLRFARYFRHEFRYDFVQYGVDGDRPYRDAPPDQWDSPANTHAYLFIDDSTVDDWSFCVGACCFRRRYMKQSPPYWGLQWAWLHPFARNDGIFTKKALPLFKERYGNVYPEPPLSKHMRGIVQSHNLLTHPPGIEPEDGP